MNTVPLGMTYDYARGYTSGQRTCHSDACLTKSLLKSTALTHLGQLLPCQVTINAFEFISGFLAGYVDERDGLAQPLE